jgi:hypothetical protein
MHVSAVWQWFSVNSVSPAHTVPGQLPGDVPRPGSGVSDSNPGVLTFLQSVKTNAERKL